VKVSTVTETEAAQVLGLISRSNMEDNLLETIWKTYYVDRTVKQVLRELLETPDKSFVRLLHRRARKLTAKEIFLSLQRLRVRIDWPTTPLPGTMERPKQPPSGGGKKRPGGGGRKIAPRVGGNVRIQDLIAGGLLQPPVHLFRNYKGHELQARVLADGAVEFRGNRYDSPSTAAELARDAVTGRRMQTNGWSFWQYLDAEGNKTTLLELRSRFLAMKGQGP
jgi:hypothetical protein